MNEFAPYDRELSVGLVAVHRASQFCEEIRRTQPSVRIKGDDSPVTLADYGSQLIVASHLVEAFPDAAVVAEEDVADIEGDPGVGTSLRKSLSEFAVDFDERLRSAAVHSLSRDPSLQSRHWTLDPLDGTQGFLRGDQYCVALALIEGGQVRLGILACPNLSPERPAVHQPKGCLFFAVVGHGAWMMPLAGGAKTALRVGSLDDPRDIEFCESVERGHSRHDTTRELAEHLGVRRPPVRLDSQCKYAIVARGDCTAYLRVPSKPDYEEKIWDHAAGALIVREAGGQVTDLLGRDLDFSAGRTLRRNRGILASNGRLHEAILTAIHRVQPQSV